MNKFNLIILAGGEKGPLYEDTGQIHKAMIPVHGKPMLDWVIDAFHEISRIEHIVVVGDSQLDQLASMRYVTKRLDPGLNVVQNLMSAVGYIKSNIYQNQDEHNGYLLSFCDAVFLTPSIIEDTLQAIEACTGHIVLHYVEQGSFLQAGLTSKRTYIPVDGKHYTGTTIYYIRKFSLLMNLAPKLLALRKARKEPDKLFELLGCGEKTIPAIEAALSREAVGKVRILISPHPGLGMDVDKPSDLLLARQQLASPWRHTYRKCLVIYNPQSGQSAPLSPLFREILGIKQKKFEIYETQKDYVTHILRYLQEYGITADARGTESPGHATEIARGSVDAGYDLVIAVGGDGTVNEVVNGLVGLPVTLGVIPLGTVNVLGIQMKLPPEIKAACQVIAAGRTCTIDLGQIQERYFVSMAGVGFDAHVVRKIDSRLKRIYGALAFAITAFKQLLVYRFKPIVLKIDDQPIPRKGYFVIIGNGKYYGGKMIVATYADISDGYLDVCIFKHKSLFRLLTYFFWMRRGRIDRDLSVEYFQCRKISILKSGRHAVHVDAEYLCKSPVEIRICPGAITLAV